LSIGPSVFGEKFQTAKFWNDIGRNFLLGNRKKIAKCFMRTFTCRSTFLDAGKPVARDPTPEETAVKCAICMQIPRGMFHPASRCHFLLSSEIANLKLLWRGKETQMDIKGTWQ
jgi:hypothetical protein